MPTTPRLFALLTAVSLGCSPTTSNNTNPPSDTTASGGGGGGSGPTIGGSPEGGTTAGGATDGQAGGAGGTAGGTGPGDQGGTGPGPGVIAGSPNDTRFLGPEISHSKGVPGGVVVLWPRIIPSAIAAENQAIAQSVQAKVRQVVERALPGKPIDMRPSPERVCPKAGCDGMSVGVLFSRQKNSCIAVALINGPGPSQTKLISWGGEVQFKSDTIQFRDPPENFVTIKDYANCDQLVNEMTKQDGFVEAAIRAASSAAPVTAPAAGATAPVTAPAPATTPAPAATTPAPVTAKPVANPPKK